MQERLREVQVGNAVPLEKGVYFLIPSEATHVGVNVKERRLAYFSFKKETPERLDGWLLFKVPQGFPFCIFEDGSFSPFFVKKIKTTKVFLRIIF